MKIFVTGGTGFIGGCLIKALLKEGHSVFFLVSEKEKNNIKDAIPVIGNLTHPESYQQTFQAGIDIVYHLAAIRYEWGFSWDEYEKVNIEGTRSLLETSLKHNVKKFIYCSSVFVFGYNKNKKIDESFPYHPTTLYAKSKVEAEKIVRSYSEKGLFTVTIRPTITYGPEDKNGMFLKLCKLLESKKFPILGSGKIFLHLNYIDDTLQGFLKASETKESGKEYIISGEESIALNDLARITSKELGTKPPKLKIPLFAAKTAGLAFEIIYATGMKLKIKFFEKEPLITRSKVDILTGGHFFDNSLAKKELGYFPKTSYTEGVKKTINWYKQHGLL